MKKVFSLALIAIATMIFTNVQAQKHLENSLLWEIKGNGLEQSSYLYGTYHLLCPEDFLIKEKTLNAFDKSSQLILEVNFGDTAEINSVQRKLSTARKISDLLTRDEQIRLDTALRKYYSIGYKQVENVSAMMLSSLIIQKGIKCADVKNPELELIKRAGGQNKTVGQLETAVAQIDFLNKAFSPSMLVAQIEQTPSYLEVSANLLKEYKAENMLELEKIFTNPVYMTDEATKWLFTIRNHNWVKKMPEMMKEKSTFFAIGALHLIGDEGLINLLRDQGYTVNAIIQ